MPLEWAKALRPTIALLGCTGMFMRLDTNRLMPVILVALMLVSMLSSLWERSAMTTSSRDVLLGTLADTVDGHFRLTCAAEDATDGVGCCHAEVVVAMGGNPYVMNAVDVLHEVANLLFELPGRQ